MLALNVFSQLITQSSSFIETEGLNVSIRVKCGCIQISIFRFNYFQITFRKIILQVENEPE